MYKIMLRLIFHIPTQMASFQELNIRNWGL